MDFTVCTAEQRSREWFSARLGRLTGSRASDMLAVIKTGEAAARRDYRMQLVCERLTGQLQEDGFVSPAMVRGIETEPAAREAYRLARGFDVQQTGFLSHNDHMAGCSLDGHVGDYEGIVEIKCPKSATHLRYLRMKAGEIPSEHVAQVVHNLWITGAHWCDFVSFDDRFPESLRLVIVRYRHDPVAIANYEKRAIAFLSEVEADVLSLGVMEQSA